MMNPNDRIHVALSPWDLTDDYNRHAGVTLLSILEHSIKPVTAHILYDERLCAGKEKEMTYHKSCYQKIADKFGCELEFHHIDVPNWVASIPRIKLWNTGILSRLHLPEILPQVNKILYFDCDMVVNTSVDTLWNIELHDTYLGACLDRGSPYIVQKYRQIYTKLKIPTSTYFNSGLLLLNLKKIRENSDSFLKSLYQFLSDNPDLPFPDQDALNWYCQGSYTQLSPKYNTYTRFTNSLDCCNDAILHYTGSGQKPWERYSGKIDLYYWKYAVQTPWLEDIDALITAIHSAPDVDKALHYVQEDFLAHIPGTRIEKARYALKFIHSIIISCFRGCRRNR